MTLQPKIATASRSPEIFLVSGNAGFSPVDGVVRPSEAFIRGISGLFLTYDFRDTVTTALTTARNDVKGKGALAYGTFL